jgi:nicotinate-nucleotide pyrophosphorylase (carboxylating)
VAFNESCLIITPLLKFEIESSGGITEKTIAAYAKCGVNFISVGALTHHVKSMDLSLKVIK